MIKQFSSVVFLIIVSTSLLFTQTNYSLYSLSNVSAVCLSDNGDLIYGVSWQNDASVINSYDVKTGELKGTFSSDIPENPIKLMVAHQTNNLVYLITEKKIDDTGNRYIDQIYSLNVKNGKVKQMGKVYYNYLMPNKVGIVGDLLVLTTHQKPTYVFDLKKQSFRLLNPDIHYQLLSIAPSHNGFLMLNIEETYQGNIPVYFMTQSNEFSNVIGYVKRELTIQSHESILPLPTITLVDSSYVWISDDIRYNSFPIYNFELVMRPFWLRQAVSLDKAYILSGILDANKTYIVAKSGFETYVYNYSAPNFDKPTTLTQQDIDSIQSYLNQRGSYDQIVLASEKVDAVFDALFYEVYKNNRFKYIAVQFYGAYFELNDYSQLVSMFQFDFKLTNTDEAQKLQDALDVLFPVDSFNKKELAYSAIDGGWRFIRGEAFGKKYGIIVKTDSNGKVIAIEYKSEF